VHDIRESGMGIPSSECSNTPALNGQGTALPLTILPSVLFPVFNTAGGLKWLCYKACLRLEKCLFHYRTRGHPDVGVSAPRVRD
jgi:hypothetical protein